MEDQQLIMRSVNRHCFQASRPLMLRISYELGPNNRIQPTQMKLVNLILLTFLGFLSYSIMAHADGTSVVRTLFIFKPDGTIQCDKSQGVTLGSMEQELRSADIKVHSTQKGYDGRDGIALCGAPTGQINVYEIASSDVSEAFRLGFKQLPENWIRRNE